MNKSTWESTVKPVVVLSVIALVVSFLLALVNSFTAPIIEENQKAATLAAYVDVMPTVSDAKTLEEVTGYTTENVTGVVKAEDGSIAIKAEEKGFERLALLEEAKSMPWNTVWDMFCMRNGVPVGEEFIAGVEEYEAEVTSKRC